MRSCGWQYVIWIEVGLQPHSSLGRSASTELPFHRLRTGDVSASDIVVLCHGRCPYNTCRCSISREPLNRMARYRVTVDTGGTFSDFVYLNEESGKLSIAKLP